MKTLSSLETRVNKLEQVIPLETDFARILQFTEPEEIEAEVRERCVKQGCLQAATMRRDDLATFIKLELGITP